MFSGSCFDYKLHINALTEQSSFIFADFIFGVLLVDTKQRIACFLRQSVILLFNLVCYSTCNPD